MTEAENNQKILSICYMVHRKDYALDVRFINFPFRHLTKIYIIPTSKGGADANGNLHLLCNACDSLKGDRPQEYVRATLDEQRK